MKTPNTRTETILCAGDIRTKLAKADIGKRRLVAAGSDASEAVTLHDTFDGQIAARGQLLIAVEGGLWLVDRRGHVTRQAASAPSFVSDMLPGPVTGALAEAVSPLRRILPLGSASKESARFALLDDEQKTRARCLLWVIRSDEGSDVTLARVDPLRGYERDAQRLARRLLDLAGDRILSERLATRELFPQTAGYEPKPKIGLDADEPAFRTANRIIAAHLPVARANEPGILADLDSEFLHDYRVALRKIRSVLSLFKGTYTPDQTNDLKARFAALMAETGRLRDLDVYLIDRERYLGLVPAGLRPGLEMLFESLARDRETAHRELSQQLGSDAYAKQMKKLERLFSKPDKRLEPGPEADRRSLDYARRLIWKRYRKVRQIATQIDGDTPDEQVHQLRIQCKKLRYLMEFFMPLYDARDIKGLIKSLKKLQDNLGAFNDYAVQQQSLSGILDEMKDGHSRRQLEIARSVGALLTVLHQKQLEERGRVMENFVAFDAPETRANLAKLCGRKALAE